MVAPRIMTVTSLIFIYLMITPISMAAAPNPMEVLKPPIDNVISILNDPKYKSEEKALKTEQREKIWNTVNAIFDFEEVSKRALARNWKKFSATEKKEFIDVFGGFLGNTYVDKIQGEYHNEKIVYGDQKVIDGEWALVQTKIKRETLEIPVDYKMKLINGNWRIYDVVVEGVSLIKNYRIQFNSILKKEKPAGLIERLKKKKVASE